MERSVRLRPALAESVRVLTLTLLDDMVAAYREAAIRHGDGQESGNAARCNAALDDLERVRADLRRQGSEGIARMRALLDDEERSVRCCAAVDALDFAPEDGLRVLRDVANGPLGMIRLGAEMVIEEWEAGRWPPGS